MHGSMACTQLHDGTQKIDRRSVSGWHCLSLGSLDSNEHGRGRDLTRGQTSTGIQPTDGDDYDTICGGDGIGKLEPSTWAYRSSRGQTEQREPGESTRTRQPERRELAQTRQPDR